ncbi:MAG: M28 family peptidase [Pseudomonadota bacterium]
MSFSHKLVLAALAAASSANAQQLDTVITPAAMRAHIEFLASDALEGRETGKRGYDVAAQYVASEMLGAGLQPVGKEGWFQVVPFKSLLVDDAASRLTIAGQSYTNRKDVILSAGRNGGSETIEGPVIFGGFCIDDPKAGQNDLKGLNVKGKIVACLSGFPKGMKSDVGAHYNRTKGSMVERAGGIGVITIRTREREKTRTWAREIEGPVHPALAWTLPDGSGFTDTPGIRMGATLGDAPAAALFAGAPKTLDAVLAEADKDGGRPKGFALKQTVKLERTTIAGTLSAPNVIGMLPGSDPALAGEYVLLMAHLDHLGIDPKKQGDQIFNGAMDNASGTASLLEAARALALQPKRQRRPVLFVAVTAEERGLLGSDYLARHPVVGTGKVVAVVNLDMPVLLYDFQDVIAFGAEHSTLGPIVAKAGERMGVTLSPDPLPAEGLFTRSDHYRFVQQGVPSVFLMTGFKNGGDKQFADFLKTHYHKVSDDTNLPIDWNAAAKFAKLNTLIAEEIANADQAPQWYKGSFFGNVFAPAAPKAEPPK